MIVAVDQIHHLVARFCGVSWKLAREVRALHAKPPAQARRTTPRMARKAIAKRSSDRFCPARNAFAQMRDQRIEQIGEDGRDRDRDQDRLEESD